jgi:hypothetical protein
MEAWFTLKFCSGRKIERKKLIHAQKVQEGTRGVGAPIKVKISLTQVTSS